MNLVERLSYYPNISDKMLKKYSSQEALSTRTVEIQNQLADKSSYDDKLIEYERGKITDPYRGPELPASAPETSRTNIGKVRQLFEQRRKQTRRTFPNTFTNRTAIGRDKSYPLQPIRRPKQETYRDDSFEENQIQPIIYDCSIFGRLPNLGGTLLSDKKSVEMKSNFSKSTETSANSSRITNSVNKITEGVARLNTKTIQKKPVLPSSQQRNVQIKKSTRPANVTDTEEKKVQNYVDTNHVNGDKNISNDQNEKRKPNVTKNPIQASPSKNITRKPLANGTQPTKKPLPTKTPPPGMGSCKICGRHFALERIKLHQEICEKTSKKKRKAFDPVKHRLKGTEAEGMINQIKSKVKTPPPPKKTDWRKKHEEFLNNIRAARMVKQHLAQGGKLSDLPPPPPTDTSDYLQCPHCGRKFNESAAERHIPKCATMKHNKPKPNVPAARSDPSKTRNKINTTRKR